MLSFIGSRRVSARLFWVISFLIGAALLDRSSTQDWPGAALQGRSGDSPDLELIRSQRMCVVNTRDTAGEIGEQVVFRSKREGDRLTVAYFVHWSTERPWGDRSMMASLAIDSVYSHLLFVLPGLRYFMHGPGDVEGATIVYRVVGDELEIIEGFADDESHDPVRLSAHELTDADQGTVLMTSVWSHQLGARSAAQMATAADAQQFTRHCYAGTQLVPLTSEIAQRFRLGSASAPLRARPAWR